VGVIPNGNDAFQMPFNRRTGIGSSSTYRDYVKSGQMAAIKNQQAPDKKKTVSSRYTLFFDQ
jgi:hypothetical protein